MSSLGDAIDRRRKKASAPPAPLAISATPPASAPPAPPRDERSELHRRRDDLAEQVTELHWDLGGLAYEMATRDHFRLDVLVRRAAVLQERDAELAEVERLLALQDSASAGNCPGCGAPHSRGAVFCWQCGATLMAQAPSTAMPTLGMPLADARRDAETVSMDALLAPDTSASRGRPSASARSDTGRPSGSASHAED
ncbi:MAG TPA: hypothetical protein VHT25_09825 [Solirubrobacteraceae bacterium]|jgi:hypothetical protein|nr:hypothetical protein [Solirubrobacteraceae bacterium]